MGIVSMKSFRKFQMNGTLQRMDQWLLKMYSQAHIKNFGGNVKMGMNGNRQHIAAQKTRRAVSIVHDFEIHQLVRSQSGRVKGSFLPNPRNTDIRLFLRAGKILLWLWQRRGLLKRFERPNVPLKFWAYLSKLVWWRIYSFVFGYLILFMILV